MKKAIYNDLISQYQHLTLEEKNAILIYKSQLYNILNAMSSIPNFMDMDEKELLELLDKKTLLAIFDNYKRIVFLNQNITTRYTIFNGIDFSDIYTCMRSLKRVYNILQQAKDKIVLRSNLTVFRGISTDKDTKSISLARGDLLSTGIKLEDAFTFLFHKNYNHLFILEVEAGTPALVTPYALITTYPKNEQTFENIISRKNMEVLKVMKLGSKVQEEILLFQDTITYTETMCLTEKTEDFEHPLTIHYGTISPKEKTKKEQFM